MFCPVCRDEFRPGFTRCASCDVELVEGLGDAPPRAAPSPASRPAGTNPVAATVSMAEYCGFVSLEEARGARDRLRLDGIRSEIVIRDAPHPAAGEVPEEEYWLRVDRGRFR